MSTPDVPEEKKALAVTMIRPTDGSEAGVSFKLRARISVKDSATPQADIPGAVCRPQFRQEVQHWINKNYPGHQFALGRRAEPVFSIEGDRSSELLGYELSIDISRPN